MRDRGWVGRGGIEKRGRGREGGGEGVAVEDEKRVFLEARVGVGNVSVLRRGSERADLADGSSRDSQNMFATASERGRGERAREGEKERERERERETIRERERVNLTYAFSTFFNLLAFQRTELCIPLPRSPSLYLSPLPFPSFPRPSSPPPPQISFFFNTHKYTHAHTHPNTHTHVHKHTHIAPPPRPHVDDYFMTQGWSRVGDGESGKVATAAVLY